MAGIGQIASFASISFSYFERPLRNRSFEYVDNYRFCLLRSVPICLQSPIRSKYVWLSCV